MENQVQIRELTKGERRLLDNYNLSKDEKSVIKSIWQQFEEPLYKEVSFSSKLMGMMLLCLMQSCILLFPVILLIQFMVPELLLPYAKLWESLFNVSRFIFWASCGIGIFLSIYSNSQFNDIRNEQKKVRETGSTDKEEEERRKKVFIPLVLDPFKRKTRVKRCRKLWGVFTFFFVIGTFIVINHYWFVIPYLLLRLFMWGDDNIKSLLVKEEFKLKKDPPKEKPPVEESPKEKPSKKRSSSGRTTIIVRDGKVVVQM